MKLSRFIISIISVVAYLSAYTCGPFEPLSSSPFRFHFYQDKYTTHDQYQNKVNIRLWQTETSVSIPDTDIIWAVYSSSYKELDEAFSSTDNKNKFIKWITDHKANDIKEYLLLAKELEELRFNRISPWFYPADKTEKYDSGSEAEKFESVMKRCQSHLTGNLSDRYSLQYIRALMATGKYDECIAIYEKKLSRLPDTNLFKKMIKGYVAGCYYRLGNKEKSNRLYAEAGDFNSIVDYKKPYFKTIVYNNPESEVVKVNLNEWIGYGSKQDNLKYIEIAETALKSPSVVNRGDWLYLIAYVEETWNGNHGKALKYVNKALNAKFSMEEMRLDALTMKLCLEAEKGKLKHDLSYYVDKFQDDPTPFYFYIVPALLKKNRINEALLLTNYASYIEGAHQYCNPFTANEKPDNTYASTGFQLMLSLPARNVIQYKQYLESNSTLVNRCIDSIRHDNDYLNEIIGTLLLREGNYEEAVKYFASVSEGYQENLNIKKGGFLLRNPWVNSYMPHDKWEYPASKEESNTHEQDIQQSFNPANASYLNSDSNAKLNFATQMASLEKIIRTGNPDERGLARIRYAFARYNSFGDSWALTQYWKGESTQCDYRPLYWLTNRKVKELTYLKDLPEQMPDKGWLNKEVSKGIKELNSDEAKAEAEFLIGNYKKIAKRYSTTVAGKYLSAHCDSWKEWL